MNNPQTTIAPTFLTHIISAIDGVDLKHHKSNLDREAVLLDDSGVGFNFLRS